MHLYGESENAFWLDSSKVDERARFSFIGDASGPLGATVAYDVKLGEVRVERNGARRAAPGIDLRLPEE